MADKKYKRLSRADLLRLLIEENERNEDLERKLREAQSQLASREIKIARAGSLAEAALAVSGIFEVAESACAQYMGNIQRLSEEQDRINAAREAESQRKAAKIIEEAMQRANQMEEDVKRRCEKIVELAKGDVAKFRKSVSEISR